MTVMTVNCEEATQRVTSMNKEFYGPVEKGVFDRREKHGHTSEHPMSECIDSETRPAVTCGLYFENKLDSEKDMAKRKERIVPQGHPCNMQKGVHYNETFAATLSESTARIRCAPVAGLYLDRRALDSTRAFCVADKPKGQLLALMYMDSRISTRRHASSGTCFCEEICMETQLLEGRS